MQFSCQKQNNPQTADHLLGVFTEERMIKVRQAVGIYDSTALSDSLDFVYPPTHSTYQWKISPADNTAQFSDRYKNGRAEIIFDHSGIFQISADIYDSLSGKLTGRTDAVTITVTKDTLYSEQAIQANDGLSIAAGVVVTQQPSVGLSDTSIQLELTSLDSYDYYFPYIQFNYTAISQPGNYSFVFADSIQLVTYPLAFGYGTKSQVMGSLDLRGLKVGTPAALSITWLGKVYTGTVTLLPNRGYSYNWDNSGPVTIR